LEGEALTLPNANGLVRRTLHDARSASTVADAKPAYAAGFRAALATVLPLLAAPYLPPGAGTWMSLAGLNGAIMDRGGPYRLRARILTALAIASAAAVVPGSLLGGHVVAATVATFVIAMLCGLARAWPDFGPGFGVTILVTFAIALAIPAATVEAAFVRGGYIVAGGLWAMVLSTVLWPLRPYRPVRLRVAECYRAVARLATAQADDLAAAGPVNPADLTGELVAVRTAIESARTTIALSRRARATETGRGERLLVLHEIADQSFVHLIALLEETAALSQAHAAVLNVVLPEQLRDIAATLEAIAAGIESETGIPRIHVAWNVDVLRASAPGVADLLARMADYANTAAAVVASLNTGHPVRGDAEHIDIGEPEPPPVLFSPSAIVRPDSSVLHHALRIAIVTTAAVLLSTALHLNHGYWVTLTAVVILQPFAAATRQKALQRIVGTVLGAMFVAGLTAVFHGDAVVLVVIAVFTMLCVALLPLNYGAYAVFGTPAFVLLAETSAGDWHLAGLRIVNTLIGGALALIGATVLWPGEERQRLPEFAAASLRATKELFDGAIVLLGDPRADIGRLRDARRRLALAASNAEESFQRLLSEHRGPPEHLEAIMTVLVYTRRLAASSAALALVGNATNATPADPPLEPFARTVDAVFADLADAVASGRAPAPFPPVGSVPLPDAKRSPIVYQRLVRLARQLKLMHDAVERWVA